MTNLPLPEIPGGWHERQVDVGACSFTLTLPVAPDAFLDDAAVLEANRTSDHMPYWSLLWPASFLMARLIPKVTEEQPVGSSRGLEIGAGIGLVGIAALAAGLDVTFSDYDETAVRLAQHNAAQNGFVGQPAVLFDWRKFDEAKLEPFPLILGCDVVYEQPNHPLVLNVLERLLEPGGTGWLGDPGRGSLREFVFLAEERGFQVAMFDEDGVEISCDLDRQRSTSLRDLRFVVNEFRLLRLRRSSL